MPSHGYLDRRAARGAPVNVTGMSEGARPALPGAAPQRGLQLQTAKGPPPFIADDLFISFDDGRTLAGLKVLGEGFLAPPANHRAHTTSTCCRWRALGKDLNVVRLLWCGANHFA